MTTEAEKINLSKKREELRKDIDYLFSKINWSASFLDAKAITIMNEFWKDLIISDKEFIRLLKEEFKLIYHQYNSGNKKGSILVCFEDLFEVIDKLAGDKLTK